MFPKRTERTSVSLNSTNLYSYLWLSVLVSVAILSNIVISSTANTDGSNQTTIG